jgi:hypothetical protein
VCGISQGGPTARHIRQRFGKSRCVSIENLPHDQERVVEIHQPGTTLTCPATADCSKSASWSPPVKVADLFDFQPVGPSAGRR